LISPAKKKKGKMDNKPWTNMEIKNEIMLFWS